jgi:hypothetical protein
VNPASELWYILLGNADQVKKHGSWQRSGKILDKIATSLTSLGGASFQRVNKLVRLLLDERSDLAIAADVQCLAQRIAQLFMRLAIDLRNRLIFRAFQLEIAFAGDLVPLVL